MKFRTKIVFFPVIFIFLFLLVFVKNCLFCNYTGSRLLFNRLKKEDVSKIIINNKFGRIVLFKKDRIWHIDINKDIFPAKKNQILKLLDSIKKIKSQKAVSRNTNRDDLFGLSGSKVCHCIVLDNNNKQLISFFAGKYFEKNIYIRRENNNTVYLVNGAISILLHKPANFWTDYRLFPGEINSSNIILIEIQSMVTGRNIYLYKKIKNNIEIWEINKKTFNSEDAEIFINSLSLLEARAALPVSKYNKSFSGEKAVSITLKTDNNEDFRILFFQNRANQKYYSCSPKKDFIFFVSIDEIDKLIESLPL